MMNKEMNPVIIIVAIVLLVVVVGYFGFRSANPPSPPPGSYTPGVPPWLDKNHPSTLPGVHGAGGSGQPAAHH